MAEKVKRKKRVKRAHPLLGALATQKAKPFIIVNEDAQAFCGLKGGYPSFVDDWDSAKKLDNTKQYECIQRGTYHKLEIIEL